MLFGNNGSRAAKGEDELSSAFFEIAQKKWAKHDKGSTHSNGYSTIGGELTPISRHSLDYLDQVSWGITFCI